MSRLAALPSSFVPVSAVQLTANATAVLEERYLQRDEKGKLLEAPDDLFKRVAEAVAAPEGDDSAVWAAEFYGLMTRGRFLPNSPTLMNAGRILGLLSGCFVLPVADAMEDILQTCTNIAMIQRAGGGTGMSFDDLRPGGSFITSSGGKSSGPIPFWRAYAEMTNAIQQGAFRRGANMGMMSVSHPDILKFMFVKQVPGALTNYNVSVKISDKFMHDLTERPHRPHVVTDHKDRRYMMPRELLKRCLDSVAAARSDLEKTRAVDGCYGLTDMIELPAGTNGNLPDRNDVVTVGDIGEIIFANAHASGEPGVLFIDRVRECEPTPHMGLIQATNPCGEEPLLPNEACNLGSINLSLYVRALCLECGDLTTISPEAREAAVDWQQISDDTAKCVRFLDNVITINKYPTREITDTCHATRKIGLGVMGFADVLLKLGIPYDSDLARVWAERLMECVNGAAIIASTELAKERGMFPWWKGSRWDIERNVRVRNAEITCVAPTGTLSILANCSCGIEPLFNFAFRRNVLDGKQLWQGHELFEALAKKRGFWSEALAEGVYKAGTLRKFDEVPPDVRAVFQTAHDVSAEGHILMQAAFQRHVTNSISKTVNLRSDATVDDVRKVYMLAWTSKCKGLTVYRDGCRKNQPMSLAKKEEPPVACELEPVEIPEVTSQIKVKRKGAFGTMHVSITVDPIADRELEVFAQVGKGADVVAADLEAICRLISRHLRCGGKLLPIIEQLVGIGSVLRGPAAHGEGKSTSLANDLALVLFRYVELKRQYGLVKLLTTNILADEPKPAAKPKAVAEKVQTVGDDAVIERIHGRSHSREGFCTTCPKCKRPDTFVLVSGRCTACIACGHSTCPEG